MLAGRGGLGRRDINEDDYRRLYPKLFAIFRRQGASEDQARELIQETFLQACKSLDSFGQRSHLDTWVISIAKRVWLKMLRARRAGKRAADEISLDSDSGRRDLESPAFEAAFLSGDLLKRVERAIQELPEAMKVALMMYVKGVKYREIASQLGISENRVASLIRQARIKLRQEFH